MSEMNSDRLLKLAAGIAIVVVVVGAALHFGDRTRDSAGEAGEGVEGVTPNREISLIHREFEVTSHEGQLGADGVQQGGESNSGASSPLQDTSSLLVAEIEERVRVDPESETAAVRDSLEGLAPAIDACWRAVAGDPPSRAATYFLKLSVGEDGKAEPLPPLRLNGVSSQIGGCLQEAIAAADFGAVAAATTVHWPMEMDPKDGVWPREE